MRNLLNRNIQQDDVEKLFVDGLKKQLPRKPRFHISFAEGLHILVPLLAGAGIIKEVFYSQSEYIEPATLLLFLVVALFLNAWTFTLTLRRRYRAADAIEHLHYCVHKVRSYLASEGRSDTLDSVLQEILDSMADAFRIVNNRTCYITFKELTDDYQKIREVAWDSRLSVHHGRPVNDYREYPYMKFKGISNLIERKHGCARYYLCNNIKKGFRENWYGHPLLEQTTIKYGMIQNWPQELVHEGTLLVPVRYLTKASLAPDRGILRPYLRGFICIDSVRKGCFDRTYSVELASAYADLIYILLIQAEKIVEREENYATSSKYKGDEKRMGRKDRRDNTSNAVRGTEHETA